MGIKKCKYKVKTEKDLDNLSILLSNFGISEITTLSDSFEIVKIFIKLNYGYTEITKTFDVIDGYIYFELNY